jgi:hypothetical protein
METSAITGEGVEEVIAELIRLGLEGKQQSQKEDTPASPIMQQPLIVRNKELDLRQRYAPKEESCCPCCLPILRPVSRLLRRCEEESL